MTFWDPPRPLVSGRRGDSGMPYSLIGGAVNLPARPREVLDSVDKPSWSPGISVPAQSRHRAGPGWTPYGSFHVIQDIKRACEPRGGAE